MKKAFAMLALGLGLAACEQGGGSASSGKPQFNGQMDSVSYAVGLQMGQSVRQDSININPDLVAKGIAAGMKGDSSVMNQAAFVAVMTSFQQTMMQKQMAKQQQQQQEMSGQGEANKAEGEKFLAENKGKQGIVTTASGLQYQVIEPGSGASPKPTDKVKVNYRGTLINGTEFDKGDGIEFAVGGVIPGWTEAVQLMKPGAKFKLFVPSNLAYGENGAPPKIGPNATLIFDVELLEVKAGDGAAAKPDMK
ncbi:MAG: FKBP-type peptidyl-prolyl cis-trans isomerase [Chlorobi bacterium]|nr:MAG: FKBP-type peptidyl-prolyl cis-trans isomerase [Chlorobi bacterium OLB7]MBK8911421.1 FKBP-type peptidyl-prolyl cis-trans isomerase [Chlorobiota bacterium]MBX7217051.1 FKBP-type peptidyl-prolyl cis-trans isomerase [Candidatus Kapabacteria bacterium]